MTPPSNFCGISGMICREIVVRVGSIAGRIIGAFKSLKELEEVRSMLSLSGKLRLGGGLLLRGFLAPPANIGSPSQVWP